MTIMPSDIDVILMNFKSIREVNKDVDLLKMQLALVYEKEFLTPSSAREKRSCLDGFT